MSSRRQSQTDERSEADFRRGWALLDAGRERQGFKVLLSAARAGNLDAQLGVGYLLDIGKGTTQSLSGAMAWYRKAARHGNAYAATNMGILYRGRNSRRRARVWFRKAVALGDAEAMLDLAKMEAETPGRQQEAMKALRQLVKHNDITPGTREQAQALLSQLRLRPKT